MVAPLPASALGQVEVMPWGNLAGIRVEGQLAELQTSVLIAKPDWSEVTETAKEIQEPRYSRDGGKHIIGSKLESLSFREVVEDVGPGAAQIALQLKADADIEMAGAFFCVTLPSSLVANGTMQVIDPAAPTDAEPALASFASRTQSEPFQTSARGIRFVSPARRWEITFGELTTMMIRNESAKPDSFRVYLTLFSGNATVGQTVEKTLTLTTSGEIDRNPVLLVLDASRPGAAFQGLGGNFRIQNLRIDPPVIQYNLLNMRVSWGRVEMPWRLWHPKEEMDPIQSAEAGRLDPRVLTAMEMARSLVRRRMPVIVSAWSAPAWAIEGPFVFRPQPGAPRGNPLKPEKMDKIYQSIGSYLTYLKRAYGVEAALFSFNESDLGINVRQTGEEHAALIKGLGAYLASQGLATKMLLGDNSDATTTDFILPALNDLEARPYIGAVSFHSWRGWSDELLAFWGNAARKLNAPLLVGEGSTDAAAWLYPQVFKEPWFAMQEITLYTRICAIAQPLAILQWQLTADYSILAGGGVFGEEGPLKPTRRFWNLKQLSSTPEGSFVLPITCRQPNIDCAAFGNIAAGLYAVHIVNNGAGRPATLEGLPSGVKTLRVIVTDDTGGMEEKARVEVSDGKAELTLDAWSFSTLLAE